MELYTVRQPAKGGWPVRRRPQGFGENRDEGEWPVLLTGAQILMECLLEQEVDTVFGFPGGTIMNVYNALPDYPGIRHILTAHEQGACHAADGYAP